MVLKALVGVSPHDFCAYQMSPASVTMLCAGIKVRSPCSFSKTARTLSCLGSMASKSGTNSACREASTRLAKPGRLLLISIVSFLLEDHDDALAHALARIGTGVAAGEGDDDLFDDAQEGAPPAAEVQGRNHAARLAFGLGQFPGFPTGRNARFC